MAVSVEAVPAATAHQPLLSTAADADQARMLLDLLPDGRGLRAADVTAWDQVIRG